MTNLVAGMLAGTLEACLVVAPVETVKTRLVDADKGLLRGGETTGHHHRHLRLRLRHRLLRLPRLPTPPPASSRGAVYDFVQAEGISGIYRGLFATICKSASNQALRFVIFGEYKRYVWGNRPKASPRPPRPPALPPCSGAAPSLSPPLTAPAVAAPLSAPATRQEEMPPVVALGGGMVAGALGSVITMPFDVLKTKMQGLGASK